MDIIDVSPIEGTDKTKITRKPSKTGKHGHGKQKSTKEAGKSSQSQKVKALRELDYATWPGRVSKMVRACVESICSHGGVGIVTTVDFEDVRQVLAPGKTNLFAPPSSPPGLVGCWWGGRGWYAVATGGLDECAPGAWSGRVRYTRPPRGVDGLVGRGVVVGGAGGGWYGGEVGGGWGGCWGKGQLGGGVDVRGVVGRCGVGGGGWLGGREGGLGHGAGVGVGCETCGVVVGALGRRIVEPGCWEGTRRGAVSGEVSVVGWVCGNMAAVVLGCGSGVVWGGWKRVGECEGGGGGGCYFLQGEVLSNNTNLELQTSFVMAQPVQNINHSAFKSMFEREKLSGNNFNDWFRQLKLVLRVEKKMFIIEQPLPAALAVDSDAQVLSQWNAIYWGILHIKEMKGYVDQLERLGYMLLQDLIVGLILNGLTKYFVRFMRNYNMHNMGKTIGELHAMLIDYEKGLPKKAKTPQVMMIKCVYIPKPKNPKPSAKEHLAKDDTCHHCKEVGHWKRNCPVYLVELLKKKKQVSSASSSDTDIRPSNDTEPMVEVPYTAEYNVFVVETQHSEQPESINDTHVMEKDDSNVISDSSNMCDNDNQADQNAEACDDERVTLANLIANLKLDIDENKKIQKQLKKANASLTQELKECKSTLEFWIQSQAFAPVLQSILPEIGMTTERWEVGVVEYSREENIGEISCSHMVDGDVKEVGDLSLLESMRMKNGLRWMRSF
ncbi:retrotransposon protein, putative, ty1-copia subclass [Tanacetum coccineum]|uniref:Retrotransposon protein, putative, ty1-copia subclass n=1 Tax=Tanacetum coccineum TaxID=301880 RepID=A0ABQ5GC42_9ASTR